ncbi:hypothetical protein [Meiothermus sp.]|nr:hypothetical protein [Meiothermus sp.]GIW35474.1 MAG: hypothetical protein KatS3mg072_2807 [Meiothermus sp.]
MRRVRWFLLLLLVLALGWKELGYACTRPDCLPPGVVRSGGPSGTGR